MPLATVQSILSGAAQLLISDAPIKETSGVTTNVDNSGSAYTALTKEIVVDDAATLCPHVYDQNGTGSLADPPIIDVIVSVSTGEVMYCWKIDSSTQTLFVIRGTSKYWSFYSYSDTQYSSAASVIDGAELELLGYFTFPTRSNLIVTNGDVNFNVTQGTFRTRDNRLGYENAYTSEPANVEIVATLPRNTLPSTRRLLGYQAITDGNTPTKYMVQDGRASAGTLLPVKFLVVIPNTVLDTLPTISVGGSDHLDITECIVLPYAQPSLNISSTRGEGSQYENQITFSCSFDQVTQMASSMGTYDELARITETIS